MRRRPWIRRMGLGLAVLVPLCLVVTEGLYYFPLTPLCLDRRGTTRLPRAPDRIRLLFVGDLVLFQTRVLTGFQARRVLQDLARRSWRYGARLRVRPAPWRATLRLP